MVWTYEMGQLNARRCSVPRCVSNGHDLGEERRPSGVRGPLNQFHRYAIAIWPIPQ
ncbi:unnamed protein product, partial [Nesidiocoris tenuis]